MKNDTSIDCGAFAPQNRWLVVDDEAELSALITDLLAEINRGGVESFTSGPDALAAFSARSGEFDLLITDRDMPDLDGLELARRVRSQSPGVKVILVSAHTDDLTSEDLRAAGINAVVRKPFTLSRLEAIIRNMTCEPAISTAHASAPALAQAA